jgi:cytochrome P450
MGRSMKIKYDPTDPAQVDDHDPVLARLRREAPVSELRPGLFYVARYKDIMDVCRAPETFRQGRHIPRDLDTRTEDQLNLGETDPPEHLRVRKVLASLFSPSKISAMEPVVRSICESLVDRFAEHGTADIIADLAAPMPAAVIGSLSGMPERYHAQIMAYTEAFMLRTDPDRRKVAAANAVVAQLDAVARNVIRERQASRFRPDDVLTGLIESQDAEGRPLSEDKILTHMTKDVIVGGTETTKHLIGNLFYNLCNTAGAYERVRADRNLVPVAIEETLRLGGPAQIVFRVPAVDVEIRGCPIPAGATVALGYASANRDEEVFENPDEFSLDRRNVKTKPHLGFGHGIHLCVGAALARMETACALNAVLNRIASMELMPGFQYRRVKFFMMRGPERLDVRFGPAPNGGQSNAKSRRAVSP